MGKIAANGMASLLMATLLFSSTAQAGSAAANLSCSGKTKSGSKISVEGIIPATQEDLDLRIRVGDSSTRLKISNTSNKVEENFSKKFFVLIITDNNHGQDTVIYAIPDTVRSNETHGALRATFSAYLTTPRPGLKRAPTTYDDFLYRARLSCTYDYSV